MAAYDVQFASSAAREFRSLSPELKQRVATAVDGLSEEPRPPGVRKLAGHRRLYRIRVGSYRKIYEIDDHAQIIHITRIRHRREAYRCSANIRDTVAQANTMDSEATKVVAASAGVGTHTI